MKKFEIGDTFYYFYHLQLVQDIVCDSFGGGSFLVGRRPTTLIPEGSAFSTRKEALEAATKILDKLKDENHVLDKE